MRVYTEVTTGVIQFKLVTTLPVTISSCLLEFKEFWDKIEKKWRKTVIV